MNNHRVMVQLFVNLCTKQTLVKKFPLLPNDFFGLLYIGLVVENRQLKDFSSLQGSHRVILFSEVCWNNK